MPAAPRCHAGTEGQPNTVGLRFSFWLFGRARSGRRGHQAMKCIANAKSDPLVTKDIVPNGKTIKTRGHQIQCCVSVRSGLASLECSHSCSTKLVLLAETQDGFQLARVSRRTIRPLYFDGREDPLARSEEHNIDLARLPTCVGWRVFRRVKPLGKNRRLHERSRRCVVLAYRREQCRSHRGIDKVHLEEVCPSEASRLMIDPMNDPYQEGSLQVLDVTLQSVLGYARIFGQFLERYLVGRVERQGSEQSIEFLYVAYSVKAR